MATDIKPAPAPETDAPEDAEFAELAKGAAYDESPLKAMLAKRGLDDEEIEAFLAPTRAFAKRDQERTQSDQRRALRETRERLAVEFKLPDGSLIAGSTPREMRASAKNLRAFADSIVAQVAPKGGAAGTTDARADEFGPPPQSSGETIVETPEMRSDWNSQRRKAATAPASKLDDAKAEVMDDILKNGPRQMERKSIGQIVSRQSQAAGRAAAAKA